MLKFITGILALTGLVAVILLPLAIDRFPELSQLFGKRDQMGVMETEQLQTPEEFTDQVPGLDPHADRGLVLPDRGGRRAQPKIPQVPTVFTPGRQKEPLIVKSDDEAGEERRLAASNEHGSEPTSEDKSLTDIQAALALYERGEHK